MSGRRLAVEVRAQACREVAGGRTAAEVAASLGVSVSTVRRWVARAAAGEGLADRPRTGRPRIQDTAAAVVSAVLATAGARIDTVDYSTRAVAAATGLSQSVVARAMAQLAAPPVPPRLRLVAVAAAYPVLALGFAELPAPESAEPAARTRSDRAFRRRGAGVVAALRSSGLGRWAQQFGTTVPAAAPQSVQALLTGAGLDRIIAYDPRRVVPDRHGLAAYPDLDGFVAEVGAVLRQVEAVPGSLLDGLAAAVSRGLEGLTWSERRDPGAPLLDSTNSDSLEPGADHGSWVPDSHWLPRPNLSLTEQLAIALRQEIIDSGYRSGDRIRPRTLASRLGLPQAAVEAAVRRMIDEELLDGSRGGVRIPAVTADDVIDLYAARLVLGSVLLRGLAARPRRHLVPVRQALRRVEAVTALRRGADVDDADLRFQQELARASGLEQTARTFESLTRRLRMYISVLLLDYTPAIDRILLDDRRILRALEVGDAAAAVDAWRGKLDNAVRHMAGIAAHRGFDVTVWSRLTGD